MDAPAGDGRRGAPRRQPALAARRGQRRAVHLHRRRGVGRGDRGRGAALGRHRLRGAELRRLPHGVLPPATPRDRGPAPGRREGAPALVVLRPRFPRGAPAAGGNPLRRRSVQRRGRTASQGAEGPRGQRAGAFPARLLLHPALPFRRCPRRSAARARPGSRPCRCTDGKRESPLSFQQDRGGARCPARGARRRVTRGEPRGAEPAGKRRVRAGQLGEGGGCLRQGDGASTRCAPVPAQCGPRPGAGGTDRRSRGAVSPRGAAPLRRGGLRRALPRRAARARPCAGKSRGAGGGGKDALPGGEDRGGVRPPELPAAAGEPGQRGVLPPGHHPGGQRKEGRGASPPADRGGHGTVIPPVPVPPGGDPAFPRSGLRTGDRAGPDAVPRRSLDEQSCRPAPDWRRATFPRPWTS